MSHFLLMVDSLHPPWISIDEQSFLIPRGRANEVVNEYCKFVFLIEARCHHEVEGRGRVHCTSGDVLAFPGPCRHRYRISAPDDSEQVHAVRLLLAPPGRPASRRAKRCDEGAGAALGRLLRAHLAEFRHLPGGVTPAIRELLLRFRDEAERRALGYSLRVEALCLELVLEVLRQLAPDDDRRSNVVAETGVRRRSAAHLVERTKEWLHKNHARNVALDEIAGHLDVTPEHLARVFRRRTGETVFGHLQTLRLDRAKTLLLGSELSIAEVARAAGFSSLALFSRTFTKRFGLSARRYRQRIWETAREHFVLPEAKRSSSRRRKPRA